MRHWEKKERRSKKKNKLHKRRNREHGQTLETETAGINVDA
jgi:hypothetical protein